MVNPVGIEPTTTELKVQDSTAELRVLEDRAGIEPAAVGLRVRHSTSELPIQTLACATGLEPAYIQIRNLAFIHLNYAHEKWPARLESNQHPSASEADAHPLSYVQLVVRGGVEPPIIAL